MKIPAFSKNGDNRGPGRQKSLDIGIIASSETWFSGGTKSSKLCMLEINLLSQLEKLHIPGIGPRPSAFNIVNAKVIQSLGDHDFFFSRKIDVFPLCSVSQGGVVKVNWFHKEKSFRENRLKV